MIVKRKVLVWIICMAMVLSLTGGIQVRANGAESVCKIGETEYLTLDEALLAVVDGGVITLLQDVIYEGAIGLVDRSLTIDLKSKDLTVNSSTGYTLMSKNGTLNIGDSSEVKGSVFINNTNLTGKVLDIQDGGNIIIDVNAAVVGEGYGAYVIDNSELILNDADILARIKGVHVESNSNFEMTGDIEATLQQGLFVHKSSANVNGNIFGKSVGVYLYNGNLDIKGDITEVGGSGIGISAADESIITIDGKINANTYMRLNDTNLDIEDFITPTT